MHVSKKDHENRNRTGKKKSKTKKKTKKHVFNDENIAYLNRLIDESQATIVVLKIKLLICLCKL